MGVPALTITNPSVLGKMLVQSSIMMQASSAALVGAEAEKLQTLIAAVTAEGSTLPASILAAVNEDIRDIVCCLRGLESLIVEKIAAGTALINRGFGEG